MIAPGLRRCKGGRVARVFKCVLCTVHVRALAQLRQGHKQGAVACAAQFTLSNFGDEAHLATAGCQLSCGVDRVQGRSHQKRWVD
ncbi:hypothetical protein K504DRAFT_100860 [Pleomassaria siparia CBS 279.74]|uniref:Uncharacterized protein n=1 Tax=Pleomassaria siparia CBS 279.74 TaxID=1314801 RepID=A0A6G1JYE5_9PLEO|nr:hypothetical protein K504DRAFT_100860 [Pleomassaria siparia CBS 279.74]